MMNRVTEIDQFHPVDQENHVLLSIMPHYAQVAFKAVPEELRFMDERELRAHVKPNSSVEALRNSFWVEYAKARDKCLRMQMSSVYSGICSAEYFINNVLKSPGMTAWVMRPPVDYSRAMEALLIFGIERLREIMEAPVYKTTRDKHGIMTRSLDADAAKVVLKAYELVDMRMKGNFTQRSEVKSLHVHADVKELAEKDSMEDIERRLRDLRKRERELEQGGSIETTATEVKA